MIALVMSGIFEAFSPRNGFPFFNTNLQWPALLSANTPTGGDMGAHVYLPQHLKEVLLPSGRLLGWSNDWYAGFPALYFYFPLPALATVLLDIALPYGVAFKLVAVAGLVAYPAAVYYFIRKMGFSRSVSAIATVTGAMYIFMESFSIFGGNIKSTLAGEFSFSWSLALSLFYLGLLMRDVRAGRRFSPAAGIVLALTALSHVVTTIVVVVASLPLLLRRRGPATLIGGWGLGFALAAFWAVPFGVRYLQGFTTDMGWSPVTGLVGESTAPGTVATPLPNEFIPVLALGLVGLVWTVARRDDVSVLISMTFVPVFFYWFLQLSDIDFTIVYNGRLLPYWYLGGFIFAGLAIGLAVTRAARWLPMRRQNLAVGGALALLIVVTLTIAGVHAATGWVAWNFSGYEGKRELDSAGNVTRDSYAEYAALMNVIDQLPPGRVMWEHNPDHNRYGTPMALMLIPYWSDTHATIEGVFFESSITTPFHFLNQSEVSERPSNPVRGLDYQPLNFERTVPHLQLYNIDYYVSLTDAASSAAEEYGLEVITESDPWTIFAIPESRLVDIASTEPVVYEGAEPFLDVALAYYADIENLQYWVVTEGPAGWRRVEDQDERFTRVRVLDTADAMVSDIQLEDHRISFTTTAVGAPHVVRVSYFPNWTATGADGPYRAAPSLMVIVPTQEDVVLEFARTPVENVGVLLTLGGIGTIVAIAWWRRRRTAAPVRL